MKIAIIGYGNMGSAMVNAWLIKKICKSSDLLIFDRNPKKLKTLNPKFKTEVSDFSKIKKYDVVVLAVEPKDVTKVLEDVKPHLSKKTIIISIAAGVSVKRITSVLGKSKIARAMPNMPAQIGMGITGWTGHNINSTDKKTIQKLLGAMGHAIYFTDESKLNVVTAISGSGPAYVFYFMEALFEAAHKLGLTDEEATSLTLGTFVGASLMVNMSGNSPTALRTKVTSKKGTTDAAINVFDKNKLKKIVLDGVKAANKRAEELNQ